MKNITLSADEELIEQAREWARLQKSTLNSLFRQWLSDLVKRKDAEERLKALELRMSYARSGGKFSREEINALAIHARYGFRYSESLVVASALAGGAKTLFSEDLQHGQSIDSLTIQNPFLQ